MKNYRLLIIVLTILSGCTTNHGKYALLSTKALQLNKITEAKINSSTPVTGFSTCQTFTIFPLSFCSLNQAIENALAQGQGDVLVDAQVTYNEVNLFPLIVTGTWEVSGKVCKTQ